MKVSNSQLNGSQKSILIRKACWTLLQKENQYMKSFNGQKQPHIFEEKANTVLKSILFKVECFELHLFSKLSLLSSVRPLLFPLSRHLLMQTCRQDRDHVLSVKQLPGNSSVLHTHLKKGLRGFHDVPHCHSQRKAQIWHLLSHPWQCSSPRGCSRYGGNRLWGNGTSSHLSAWYLPLPSRTWTKTTLKKKSPLMGFYNKSCLFK